ncbi:MAG: hypothetical protein R3C44_23760 [Chloroflexota bacterium]
MIVVYPLEEHGRVEEILGPGRTDPVEMWQGAAEQARADIRTNASDPFVWFNLGTSLTRQYQETGEQVQLRQAVAAFDQARLIGLPSRMLWYQFTPYEAYLAAGRYADVLALAEATLGSQGGRNVEETYVYQAQALAASGDEQAASAALQRAEQLHANNPVVRQALANRP